MFDRKCNPAKNVLAVALFLVKLHETISCCGNSVLNVQPTHRGRIDIGLGELIAMGDSPFPAVSPVQTLKIEGFDP